MIEKTLEPVHSKLEYGGTSFITIDPSPFISKARLEDLLKVLSSEQFKGKSILLPTLLYDSLDSVVKRKARKEVVEVFRGWLPFYSKEHVELIFKSLSKDEEYVKMLERFFKEFNVRRFRGAEKIGRESIYLDEVKEKLRNSTIGQMIFDILAASDREAWIISFGNRTINLVERLGTTIQTHSSQVKNEIKKNLRIRRNLKIAIWTLRATTFVSAFARLFGLPISLPPEITITQFGIMIVADG